MKVRVLEWSALVLAISAAGGLAYFLVEGTGLAPSRPPPRPPSPSPQPLTWDPPAVWPDLADPKPWEKAQKALDRRLRSARPRLRKPLRLTPLLDGELSVKDYRLKCLHPKPKARVSGTAPIRLQWTPVPVEGVKYVVEIGKGLPRLSRTNRLTVEIPEKGKYRWRVRARLGPEEIASPYSSFTVR